jgi:hypothetical protein
MHIRKYFVGQPFFIGVEGKKRGLPSRLRIPNDAANDAALLAIANMADENDPVAPPAPPSIGGQS